MDFEALFIQKLKELKAQNRYRCLEVPAGLSFIHNDYLDLHRHPEILAAGEQALKLFGAGSRGSRLLGGHSRLFDEVEGKLAEFFEAPSALFFSTGYLANLGVLTALSECCTRIFSDEKNHASLIDGIRLSGLPKTIVPHNQWVEERDSKALSVSESLFSMDGTVLDWRRFLKRPGFRVIDEAHAAGIFREEGMGLIPREAIEWGRTAVVVTFGKAFGVAGAAVLGPKWLREWMVNRSRGFIYTTAPSPVGVAMVGAALKVVREEGWRRRELWDRAERFRQDLENLPGSPVQVAENIDEKRSPIIPFRIPGEANVLRFCENMRDCGVALKAIRYPTVPKGQERVRISLNLGVSRDNTETMTQLLVEKWTEFLSQEQIRE